MYPSLWGSAAGRVSRGLQGDLKQTPRWGRFHFSRRPEGKYFINGVKPRKSRQMHHNISEAKMVLSRCQSKPERLSFFKKLWIYNFEAVIGNPTLTPIRTLNNRKSI